MTQRLNKAPIFVNAMARGGSSILTNIIASHPSICYPKGETHMVFRGFKGDNLAWKLRKWIKYLPILITLQTDLFSPHRINKTDIDADKIPEFIIRHIDKVLYESKLDARHTFENKYKSKSVEYTDDEIKAARLLSKNINGVVFLTDLFRQIYPDASFVAIIRNGLAICDGHVRRGLMCASDFAKVYKNVGEKIIHDTNKIHNYHLVRYEDIVADPVHWIQEIYHKLGLSMESVPKIRIITKKVMSTSGQHKFVQGEKKQLLWFKMEDFGNYLQKDVNEAQIKNLSESDKKVFLKIAGPTMEKLRYI